MKPNDDPERMPRPDEVLTFPTEEFRYVFHIAMHAAACESPEHKSERYISLLEDDGTETLYVIADNPLSRIMRTLLEHYRDHPREFYSMSWRINALLHIIHHPMLKSRVKGDGGMGTGIHQAVIDAAASVRITRNLTFPPREFAKTVERIVEERYPS